KQEFHKLPRAPHNPHLFPDLFTTALVDIQRNRYPDVLALEASRFCIDEEPLFYFNANWVLGRTGIATHGPLENEHAEFWKMVWHSKACLIVMLVNLKEQDKPKCSQYWPGEQPMKFEEGAFTISCPFAATDKSVVRRMMLLEKNGEKRHLTQFHVTHWPDKGVIDKKDLAEIILEVDQIRSQYPLLPILGHCSAGIGRTGTFFAVLEGFDRLKKGKDSPTLVFDIVSALRAERVFMVQTPEQYVLVYETLEYLKAYLETIK
ncbi:MAG TPA: protein-tyrosine phosphatase family protein, partial [Rhabdochlamydiaceae bacterium]